MAIAQLGLAPRDFYELTPVEFNYAVKEKRETIEGKYKLDEQLTRTVCESIRISLLVQRNMNRGKNQPAIRDPKKMFSLPWDKEKKEMTLDEMKNVMKKIAMATKHKKKQVKPVK